MVAPCWPHVGPMLALYFNCKRQRKWKIRFLPETSQIIGFYLSNPTFSPKPLNEIITMALDSNGRIGKWSHMRSNLEDFDFWVLFLKKYFSNFQNWQKKSWKWVRLRWDWVCPGLWYMKRRNLMVPGPRGRVKVRISGFSYGFGVQRSFLSFTGPFFDAPERGPYCGPYWPGLK